ncbi:hypothetical protein RFI_03014 [Reticulomyxa filosa]|uniref:Uncharacterized protein n=1 Tax=Reticulomyxa filosa TaxID=46433 RepID=X6P6C8_RETFI|nr:hypothetical protein RFI_03014 [Reticulomyxa filosa]|eukprot:ETO34080.1 hypothetical protein RFI_03014 [Reticulomyxa filosa]
MTVLGTEGNSTLGGIEFDDVIKDIIREKFRTEHGWKDEDFGIELKLLKIAERVKHALTENEAEEVMLKNKAGFYSVTVTRREFETHPRTLQLIDFAIETAKRAIRQMASGNVRMMLMVGGTSQLPILQRRLREEFSNLSQEIKIELPQEPQLMVALGAAIVAGTYEFGCESDPIVCDGTINDLDDVIIRDVLPLSLGFSICDCSSKNCDNDDKLWECDLMNVIVPKNTPYPFKSAPIFYCQKDRESSIVKLKLYEGDDRLATQNYFLGVLEVSDLPPRPSNVCNSIQVQFVIDKNGIADINVTINDENQIAINQFRKQVSIETKDGSLTSEQIARQKREMKSWFPHTSVF